jgi:transposase
MANHLGMARVQAIQVLRARGWSFRRIGRELGVHRETVARYVRLAEAGLRAGPGSPIPADQNRPNPPTGSAGDAQRQGPEGQNRPNPPTGSGPSPPGYESGPPSLCEPFREAIIEWLERGLTAQRIWQDLKVEHDFTGGYDSVKRFVRRFKTATPLPFRRMECAPGEEAQIDFGTGAPILTPTGKRRRTHVFRIVLSHSRKAYSESVYRQTADDFIRAIENAFHHFGGAPQRLVVDNLKAAVIKADWFDPDLNPKILAFCEHYGTVILPTKPYMPRHKGKVERGVDYVQSNALKGRTFTNLAAQNRYLLDWETSVADTRIHGTTRQQIKRAFEEREKPALLPLPIERFPCFQEARRKVHRDGHVEVDKAYYSVPPEYVGRSVWVRWDSRLVRIFNGRFEQIAIHARHEPGRFRTADQHIPQKKRSGMERDAAYLLNKATLIGPRAGQWAAQMIHQRGIEGVRVLMGLLSLANRHPGDRIEQACEVASTHGAYRLRTIRELIKRQGDRQEQFAFIEEHPIIRSLSDYGALAHTAFTKESWQ